MLTHLRTLSARLITHWLRRPRALVVRACFWLVGCTAIYPETGAEREGRKPLTHRVEVNPAVMMGKPVIKGTRVTVELILRKLASGMTVRQIIDRIFKNLGVSPRSVSSAGDIARIVLNGRRA